MDEDLQYPIGSIIKWCDEYYKVITNYDDYSGNVQTTDNHIVSFYFKYQGEESVLVTDKEELNRVTKYFN